MRRGKAQSLAASPTLVGAVTTLIVIVAVFLAYNSTKGLPFVPTYRVSVEMPNAARVAPNNEVRIGGTRVGIVESIVPVRDEETGLTAAKLNLKLDKSAEPLPEDSTVRIRYKSSFGLKYVEILRGEGKGLPEGGTLPVSQSSTQTEFDDIANTFDAPTREASRENLVGFGSGFAGRGASLNQAIQALNPLFTNLRPVARTLTAPETRLERFFPALGRTAEIVAPVAEQQAQLFTNMAITFGALSEDPEALKATISSGPPTLAEGTPALRAQRPFLVEFADLNRRLRPGIFALRKALPTLNSALTVGAPVLRDTPAMNARLRNALVQLRSLVRQPQTKTTLLRLRETFDQAAPAASFIAPYQTVCNYWNYWFTFLPEHLTEEDNIGTSQRVSIIAAPGTTSPPGERPETPLAGYSGKQADGKQSALSPTPGMFDPRHMPILHAPAYGPAIDSAGNADCQAGQVGYLLGDMRVPGQPVDSPVLAAPNYPGNVGTTFHGRSSLPDGLQPRSLP